MKNNQNLKWNIETLLKYCLIWWILYRLRNLRLQTWLNLEYIPTYFVLFFYCGLNCRYQLLNLFFASHHSGRLYTMIDHWRCLVFSWLILYQHTVDNFSLYVPYLPTYQSYITLVHEYWNQFENWIASWIKLKHINLNVGMHCSKV